MPAAGVLLECDWNPACAKLASKDIRKPFDASWAVVLVLLPILQGAPLTDLACSLTIFNGPGCDQGGAGEFSALPEDNLQFEY